MWRPFCRNSDSAAIRTQDLLLRRQLLYPAELRGQRFVGTPRFELGISCSQSRRDNRTSLYPVKSCSPSPCVVPTTKKDASRGVFLGGEGGIRTPGTLIEYDSLANCWFQPLTHLSVAAISMKTFVSFQRNRVQKYELFLNWTKLFSLFALFSSKLFLFCLILNAFYFALNFFLVA